MIRSIALSLLCLGLSAQSSPYVPKGWVWVDNQDKGGKWHLGGLDKRQHFAAGALTAGVTWFVLESLEVEHPERWAVLMAFVVGYLKEIYDLKRGSGTAERADALMTGLGGFVVPVARWKW